MLLQHAVGPHLLVPRQFRPARYDYFRRLPPPPAGEPPRDCAICMMPVEDPPAGGGGGGARGAAGAVTPCDHGFHAECLRSWMEVKMECPVCRRPLPDID